MAKRILVVDDEEDIAHMCAEALAEAGYEVQSARNGFHAQALIDSVMFDAAVLDVSVPGATGLELAARLKSQSSNIPIVVITGYASVDPAAARKIGARAFLAKPFTTKKLVQIINTCFTPFSP